MRLQAGDPDHEEFVEVVCRDGQEAKPLEQAGGSGFDCLLENTPLNASQLSSRLKYRGSGRRGLGDRLDRFRLKLSSHSPRACCRHALPISRLRV